MKHFRAGTDGAQGRQERANGGAMTRRMSRLATLAAATALVALVAFVATVKAEPPSGVTPTLLARGTYDAFKVRSDPQGPIDVEAEAKAVFITITQGTLTYYHYDDPTCTPHTVSAGQGFVDHGSGHVVRNETDQPAQDMSVITAPVGGPFRTNLDAPNPSCGF